MMTISREEQIYNSFKDIYEKRVSMSAACELLEKSMPDIKASSYRLYLDNITKMINGETFKRSMSVALVSYCIEKIAEDYGYDKLLNSLKAAQGYVIYDFCASGSKSLSLREACDKIAQKYSVDIDFSDSIFNKIKNVEIWEPSNTEYNPNISVNQWRMFWNDNDIFDNDLKIFMKQIMLMSGVFTYKQLAKKFYEDEERYRNLPVISRIGRRLVERKYCDVFNDGVKKEWAIPCVARDVNKKNDIYISGSVVFKLRDELIEALKQEGLQFGEGTLKPEDKDSKLIPNYPKNQILYGPPGTGKTYNTINYAVAIIDNRELEDVQKESETEVGRKNILERYKELKEKELIEFCTFHQSFGYEEFIQGIKPFVKNDKVGYKVQDGVFKRFCDKAKENLEQNYVFIIDEINRGNISKIFGELITLIEESKRIGSNEEMSVRLSYSEEDDKEFGVPNNVYLLGTMNTADRSIALIDTALRRRFKFVEMQPDATLLNDVEVDGINIGNLLRVINNRIEAIYDREHTIGHSYFMNLKKNPAIGELKEIFKGDIIPLLQEYFYDDFEKIAFILGDEVNSGDLNKNFITKKKFDLGNKFKVDIELNAQYQINDDAFKTVDAYKKIYE